MTTLAKQAEAFIRQFGDDKAIAKQFNTSVGFVRKWIKEGKYPQKVFEAMFEAATAGQQAEPEPAPSEPEYEPAPKEEFQPEPEQTVLGEIKAMLQDLHGRLQDMEGFVYEQGPGARIPHSSVRPPNGAANALKAAGIVDPGLPLRPPGTGSGRAPTRAEAHASTQGPRGNPAGPAHAKVVIKPGDPGWNPGWNSPRPKPQTVQVVWPNSR
jgi:hypothetical protein